MKNNSVERQERRNFFISYVKSDEPWAEWIASQLEQNGYTTLIEAWDFYPGDNVVLKKDEALQQAERTLLILSPDYLQSAFASLEWTTALHRDPLSILPVYIRACQLEGFLDTIIPIDLVGLVREQAELAHARLLEGIRKERIRPQGLPFPGDRSVVFPGALPATWNVPYTRNPFFTGREQEIQALHQRLQKGKAATIGQAQAISGLGGVGKTQLAVAYAYRYYGEYEHVLWVNAQDRGTLTTSFSELASLLELPEKDAREQEIVTQAVKTWLQKQSGWLLILDNADRPELLPPFLPVAYRGHLLITTRVADMSQHIPNLEHSLAVDTFTDEQGALLLLHRSGLLPTGSALNQADEQNRQLALEISHELGGLPLALSQAGAYLKNSGDNLAAYQQIYRQHRSELLREHPGAGYPESVATTWNISFRAVEQKNPVAGDLLCPVCVPRARSHS